MFYVFLFLFHALTIDNFTSLADGFNHLLNLFEFSFWQQDDERRDSIPEEPENQQNNHINYVTKATLQPFEEKRCRTTYERSQSLAEPLENRQTNHFNENT